MEAQKRLLRSAQKECFNEEGRKSLKNFQVFTDNDGILRLKSRIANEDELPEFIAPLILPPKHLVIKRLIEQEQNLLTTNPTKATNLHVEKSILPTTGETRKYVKTYYFGITVIAYPPKCNQNFTVVLRVRKIISEQVS
ncbi:hypothetical protein TNCT_253461 [Trichonephila clavata]|uniref:Uncharacterized protein n=1 Tax=Trichonephila clavata TaxID=2740835 RepID=A0A8X6H4Y9_TRICU|nr:hypothetical protein TNCT_253461 [Trichonephila clavata]